LDRAAGLARACSRITGKDEAGGTAGADFKVQRELLRHSTIQSTLNTYTQDIPEQKRAANTTVVGILFNENASVDQASQMGAKRHSARCVSDTGNPGQATVFVWSLVAGACNHPNCLVLPFRFPMVRAAA